MSAVVMTRLRDLFLASAADAAPVTQVAERVAPATLAVLAAPADAALAGASLALAAGRAHRASCVVVAVWSAAEPTPPRSDLAVGAARKLTARLTARGLLAGARGRLVTVALPAAATEARAAAERTLAAAGELPVALVIAGPRPAALDPLLGAVDRVVIVPPSDAPAGLEDLAVSAAAHHARSTAVLRLPPGGSPAARALAVAGLTLPPTLRSAATSTLGGDRG